MNKIELTEGSVKILDSQKLTDKHIVLVTVDVENLPVTKATEYMERIKDGFRSILPDHTRLAVVPKGIDVQIIEKE